MKLLNVSCKSISAVTCLIALIFLVTACGGSGSSTASSGSSSSSNSYAGPGSKWDFDLKNDGTFLITHRESVDSTVDMSILGTHETLASGFLKLTVTSATSSGSETAPSAGDTAWALEVPGYALFVKPMDDDGQVIAMVKSGQCPTEDIAANWVMVKTDGGDASDNSRDFYGTFLYDFTNNMPSLGVKYALDGTVITGGGIDPGSVTCADGVLNVPGAIMYLTNNGGAIVHTDSGSPNDESDDQFIFALSQATVSDTNNLDGDYAGMLFDDNTTNPTDKIAPLSFTCTGGSCIGFMVTNVDTGAVSADSVTVTLGSADSPSAGYITGSISDGGMTPGDLACMADTDANGTGRTMLSCVGQSPGDNTKMFNVLLVEKTS